MNTPQSIIRPVLFYIETSLFSLVFLWVCSNNGYSQGAGYALDFDGVDDNVLVASSSGDELNPQTSITVECWVNLNEVASSIRRHHMVSKWASYGLIIETNGHPKFYIYDGNWYYCQATPIIQKNKWYHIAASYDGIDLKIYVNGILEGTSTPGSVLLRQNANPVRIGTGGTAPVIADFMNGKIDEVRIWDTANTITQIQQSMNQKVPGSASNLVGYWRLDDNSGTNAADLSPYGNNGTLTNMTPLSDWVTSNAPIGDGAVFSESTDIIETTSCEVDVAFGTGIDAPGAGFSMASIQINELPNNNNGLLSSEANLYWEIWSEDIDFDGDFASAVNFHYDNIAGIPNESLLVLYKRDSASAPNWSVFQGFTVFTDDGGSSTISDGIGYIQIPISAVSSGGFSGQYILSWKHDPVVTDIPDQSKAEGNVFTTINLDDYVSDVVDADADIIWTYSGNTELTVTIDVNRLATISIPDVNWYGSETITFTATDPKGDIDSDTSTFTIISGNDDPVVTDIPDQSEAEGTVFATINLDDYVSDVEAADSDIVWTYSGNTELTVTIDVNRVATIGIPDVNWYGSETITFTAANQDGDADSDAATFTITSVNDLPVVSNIQNQHKAEGSLFSKITLDYFVSDIEDMDSEITWSYSGNTELTVTIDVNRVATIGIPDVNWYGTETINFTATDKDGGSDSDAAIFDITPVNDLPVVSDIPDQSKVQGSIFATINLDDYVSDVEDADTDIVWTYSGNTELTVTIDANRMATIGIPDVNWYGSETITFTATDQDGGTNSDTVTFTITSNDAPVVIDIPDQSKTEGTVFTTINLDDYVSDVEDADADIVWTYSGNTELTVTIDVNREATIGIPDVNWYGSEAITFTATDQDGGTDNDAATFTITPVNDDPMVTDIPDQSETEGTVFTMINLDDYVSDVEDADADIVWTYSGNAELTVTIDVNRVATIGIPGENWYGSETINFTATDQDGGTDSGAASFTITSVNDAPVILSEIPDTSGTTLEEFIFTFDSLTFGDVDVDDSLSYSAALTTGDFPDWLSFNHTTRTFSGTPAIDDRGFYSIVVTATDRSLVSVTDTFQIHITGPIGIVDLGNEWDLNIYPNPGNGIFYINLLLPENEDVELKIFTMTGQLIWNKKYQHQFGDVRLTVNLSDYRKDVYIVKIVTKSGHAIKQIILQ